MANNPVLLESGVPLSQSLIWRRQREFYTERGLKAWTEDLVPQFITNNPFITEIYARIVVGFICDSRQPGSSEQEPVRILELGAGPGRFSYLFLKHLAALLQARALPLQSVRYCMTDCSEKMLEGWRANRYLAEFVSPGVLQFERMQIGEEVRSNFLGGSRGPLVVIANYVFDSLPQDAFAVADGQIHELLVSSNGPEGVEDLSHLQLSYQHAPVPPRRYTDQSWNQILENYRHTLPPATVLFPSQTLKALEELSRSTDGPMLVLAADKGQTNENTLTLFPGPPAFEFHGGSRCCSQMVNFDAIAKHFKMTGGGALLPDKHFANLNICAFLRGKPAYEFRATTAAYRETQDAFGPDDLFTLFGWLNAHMEEMTVPQILAALRLSRWDSVTLGRLFPILVRQLGSVVLERYDVREAVLRTWANHFPVTAEENAFAFYCGVALLELKFYEEAFEMFKTSERTFARTAATSFNLGLCAHGLGRDSEALAFMVEACNLDPNFEPAIAMRKKLEDGSIGSSGHR